MDEGFTPILHQLLRFCQKSGRRVQRHRCGSGAVQRLTFRKGLSLRERFDLSVVSIPSNGGMDPGKSNERMRAGMAVQCDPVPEPRFLIQGSNVSDILIAR